MKILFLLPLLLAGCFEPGQMEACRRMCAPLPVFSASPFACECAVCASDGGIR